MSCCDTKIDQRTHFRAVYVEVRGYHLHLQVPNLQVCIDELLDFTRTSSNRGCVFTSLTYLGDLICFSLWLDV